MLEPKSPGFNTVKKLVDRLKSPNNMSEYTVSVEDRDVPAWQRQAVWNDDEMGLLIYSILKGYPIGIIILWEKSDGIRVPIDGRQRLTAIQRFYEGLVAIPDLPKVDEAYRGKKYRLKDGENPSKQLGLKDRETINDYELKCVQYEKIDEQVAMDIFVMLQGGKSLTKTEIRAALGGKLCDFVTELTSDSSVIEEDEEESSEQESFEKHEFFKLLSRNLRNTRKAHRNVCDIIIHEIVYPDKDKHWSSLEKMYMEKSKTLTDKEKLLSRGLLTNFTKAFTQVEKGKKTLSPHLRSAHFILSIFKAWKEVTEKFEGATIDFKKTLSEFEKWRVDNQNENKALHFTTALSNAGYAQNRIQVRHDIFVSFVLNKYQTLVLKKRDKKRLFSIEQKIAIWERANHQCEYKDGNRRCKEKLVHPRDGDADHVVLWKDGGETTLKNGRLLCRKHNRSRNK
jgi:hypothetical protein